jgi:hypothetical protein
VKRIFWLQALLALAVLAQDGKPTNSLFDDSDSKSYVLKNIRVQGEVENPGQVDMSALPLQSIPIKELALEEGKQVFKGAYFVTGYALYDILNNTKVKKATEPSFSPPIDLYVIVENEQGDRAAFSWGEIYYAKDKSGFLVTKSIQAINPAHGKMQWPLPADSRLVCSNDLLHTRYVSNPTTITIKSYRGQFATEKPKDMYSADFRLLIAGNSTTIANIGSAAEDRKVSDIAYGHGSGFKGVMNLSGYVLKDLIQATLIAGYFSDGLAVASAKDGYRSVFSVSEIVNRSDNQDLLLLDKKDSHPDGRYTLLAPGDFFVDRDVKAVEKIEIVHAP